MGWLGAAVGGAVGGLGGAVAGNYFENKKDQYNGDLNGQMSNMARPEQVDPNSLHSVQGGLESRQANYQESPWARMQTQAQTLNEGALQDQGASTAAAQAAAARSSLAGSSGLSAGARERLARSGAHDATIARQDVARQGMVTRAGIGADDYKMKQSQDALWAQVAARDAADYNETKRNNYNEQMRGWAAGQAANAELASNKKSGLFGLGLGIF